MSCRQLKPEEAAKHSQTLFKSLYKGAANLLKGQQWQTLTATCSCMVSAGGLGNVAQSMQAVAKLAGHIPEAKAVGLLSAIISTELIGTSLEDALLSSTRGRDPETACLEVLAAAAGPASALRKASAKLAAAHAQPVDLLGAFGGPEAALKIADALEKAAAVIAVGYRLAPENSAFASQAHASAVAVATAAKLQGAACCLGHSGAMSVGACVAAVLGWEWPAWRSVPSVLSTTELSWLASSLHNIGVDLLSNCMPEDATECFKGAVAASFTVLGQLQAEGGTSLVNSVATVQVADINKRLTAFTEALLKAGKDAEAAQAAEDGLALVVYLCGQDLAAYGAQVHAAVASAVEVRCRALPPTSAAPKASSKRSGAAAAKSRARSKGGQAPSSFTGVLANHAVAVPSTSIALVAQAELAASASLLRSGGTPEWCNAAQKVAAAVVEDLLGSVYPAQAAPLEHARLLLLLHTLQLPGSSEGALDRTETAIASIRGKKHGDVQLFGALVAATRVLDGAQALVSAALERQQQAHMARQARLKHNPSEVHAEAAEIGSDDGSSAEVDAAGWEGVLEETAALVDNLSALVDLGVIGREESSTADAAALASAVRGIATLAGMHGRMALEQRLASGAGGLQHPEQWDVPSTVPALEYCLLPSALHGNSEAMPTPTMLQKAEAAMSHALVHASHGDIVSALRHAGEAQRLLAPALRSDPLAKASSADSQGADGFWRLAAAYCKGLLLLARLFEGAGMADEAAHAAKEGQRMVSTVLPKPLQRHLFQTVFSAEFQETSIQCTIVLDYRFEYLCTSSFMCRLPHWGAAYSLPPSTSQSARLPSTAVSRHSQPPALRQPHPTLRHLKGLRMQYQQYSTAKPWRMTSKPGCTLHLDPSRLLCCHATQLWSCAVSFRSAVAGLLQRQ